MRINILNRLFLKFPFVATCLRDFRDQLRRRKPSKDTPWGFTLAGNDEMSAGTFEPEETKLFLGILPGVDIVVNVGANIGYFCAHALNNGKPVIAMEPNAQNLHFLLVNMKNNGWSENVEIFPVAAGNKADVVDMWGGGTGASLVKGWASIPASYVTGVPTLKLDRILGDRLVGKRSLFVVDIEGAEFMMLKGATEALSNSPRPIWMIEIALNEHQPEGVVVNPLFAKTFEVFFSHGYAAYTADSAAIEIDRDTIAEVIQGRRNLRTHNFVFR